MDISPARKGTDELLLEMLTDPHADLPSIAAVNGLTLVQFLAWASEPRIRDALKALRRLHRARADLLAQEAAASALKTLRAIADHHDHEIRNSLPARDPKSLATAARLSETARKACHQLLRAAGADRQHQHVTRAERRCRQSHKAQAEAPPCTSPAHLFPHHPIPRSAAASPAHPLAPHPPTCSSPASLTPASSAPAA